MILSQRWKAALSAALATLALAACGGGGSEGATPITPSVSLPTTPAETGSPALTGVTAEDGRNWINFRRSQIGIPTLSRNTTIDVAAQGHSDYQKTNNIVSHDQIAGMPGFTGLHLFERLRAAGYIFSNTNYAYGEVISATSNSSGAYMAEELITAIYHRFVIFEPKFKEIGTGAARTSAGYNYFTADFAANNGYGIGIGRGALAGWPYSGQTAVATNFFSDFESPDPVAGQNEVGYPISVHADINVALTVQSFTIKPRGGADLSVKLLSASSDLDTPRSAAAIIPLAVLRGATTYDVSFSGTTDGSPITKTWSFTTK
jgi:uncharacterized protein YkwD